MTTTQTTERNNVLVLVSPNNPTGAVPPPAVLREIAELAKKHDLIVISDEIYADLIYDGAGHARCRERASLDLERTPTGYTPAANTGARSTIRS